MYKLLFLLLLCSCSCSHLEEKNYCGTIIEKGYEEPVGVRRFRHDAVYFVILKVDSIDRSIRVDCTVPTYYSLDTGTRGCFSLSKSDLSVYGNGNEHLIK